MKKLYVIIMLLSAGVFAQETLMSVDFETDGFNYTVDNQYDDGGEDYFLRTNDATRPSDGSYTNVSGYYFGVCDNDENPAGEGTVTINSTSVSGYVNLQVIINVAAVGGSNRYERNENLYLEYNIDGGGWNSIMQYSGNSNGKSLLYEDTDFDGSGDGVQITNIFTTRTYSIGSVGSTLQIRFRGLLNNFEDFAFDDIIIQGTVPVPEISVEGNSTEIVDGDVTPSLADSTDFGSTDISTGSIVRTFTIFNSGLAILNLSGVSPYVVIGGTHASDFSVTSIPGNSITPAGNSTFQISFNPTATGIRSADISIANNDADENPYNFSIQGTGTDPEIRIEGNSVEITDGDVSPSLADSTDFGNADISTGSVVRTFTIFNTGSGIFNLSGISPYVAISGTHAADFSVTSIPGNSIAPGDISTFQLTFNPVATGIRSADISIANSDLDENPYNFSIQGTGTATPEISVEGNSTEIADGDVTPSLSDATDFGSTDISAGSIVRTFTIFNTGSGILNLSGVSPYVVINGTHAADFSVTSIPGNSIASGDNSTFQVTFNPAATGIRSADISIANGDLDENPYNFSIQGTGTEPEMSIEGNSSEIADGDVTPSLSDSTDFGSADISTGSIVRTFTIFNTGSGILNLSGAPPYVVISGTHAADFSVTSIPGNPIASGDNSTFQVTFNPGATGIRSADISIANDDADENPYNFSIQGTGTEPEMSIQGNSIEISDGDVTPSLSDSTDFGSADIFTGSIARTFTILNTGSGILNLSGASPYVVISGTHAADFSVTSIPGNSIAPGGNTTFQVTFNPNATGIRRADISIANDDADENPYNFSIQGTGTATPEMSIEGNGTEITDGDVTPSLSDSTDFGSTDISTGSIVRTFTIFNTGSSNLNLSGVSPYIAIAGTHAADFSVTSIPGNSIVPADSSTFQITFNPGATGIRSADISIANDDANENPYNFSIQGTGTATIEMHVEGNNIEIADGDVTPSLADSTDFGSTDISTGLIVRTFTLFNTGSGILNLSGVSPYVVIAGTHASDFSVTSIPDNSIASADSSAFQITFNPSVTGIRSADISIANDDADENPYNFSIQGTGTATAEMRVDGNRTEITDGDATPSLFDSTDFGSTDISAGSIVRTFTIFNTGSAILNLNGDSPYVIISGSDSIDFTITSIPDSSIESGDSTTFQVTFNPSVTGIHNADISIENDDADENPYNFSIQGTGSAAPEMSIEGNSKEIADGDVTPSLSDSTDFGSTEISTASIVRTFTIFNTGSGILNLNGASPYVVIAGTHAADFTITSIPDSSIESGDSTTFQILFNPSSTGQRTAEISIANDDADENPYNFTIAGMGEAITSVKNDLLEIPAKFYLFNNYPNPFNPKTTIKYQLKKGCHVQLIVYSISGRVITKLVNNYQNAGTYFANFNAKDFVSGTYIYHLKAGSFEQSRKMVLVK